MNTLRARVLLLVAASGLATALILGVLMVNAVRNLYSDLIYRQANDFAERVIQMHPNLIEDYRHDKAGLSALMRSYVLLAPDTGLYLLSPEGEILATSGEGKIHWSRYRVDMKTVRQGLAYDPDMPLFGQDPDTRDGRCIVAAKRLADGDRELGWLYVVARSADFVTQTPELVKAYALRTGAKVGLLTLAISVALTIAMITVLTRPLTQLTRQVERVRRSGFAEDICPETFPVDARDDEIGRLANAFRAAFQRLKQESDRVTLTDTRRREMVASVSHDLRTPLTALIGQLETVKLKRATMPTPEQDRFIDGAFNNSLHLKRLTDALAELGRLDNPDLKIEREPIALHELCDDLACRMRTDAGQGDARLQVNYPDGLPLAQVDAALIERALINLIDNAMRVTPHGGQIDVDIRPAAAAPSATATASSTTATAPSTTAATPFTTAAAPVVAAATRGAAGYVLPAAMPSMPHDAAGGRHAGSSGADAGIRSVDAGPRESAPSAGDAALVPGRALRVTVTDSGPGVPEADQALVFERFYQGSGHRGLRGSSGLGLAIVRRVAELHGGRAGVYNSPGRGASFFVEIPI